MLTLRRRYLTGYTEIECSPKGTLWVIEHDTATGAHTRKRATERDLVYVLALGTGEVTEVASETPNGINNVYWALIPKRD